MRCWIIWDSSSVLRQSDIKCIVRPILRLVHLTDWQKCKLLKTEKNKEMTSQQCFFYLKLYKECEMLHTYCQKKLSGLKISLGTYTYYISYYFGVFLVVICILNTIHCKVSKNPINLMFWLSLSTTFCYECSFIHVHGPLG